VAVGGQHRLMKTTLVVLALVLAGCGSDVSAAPGPTDRQLAVRSVLVLKDFPSGWKAGPRPESTFSCAGTAAARKPASGVAESQVFDTRAKNTEAAGTVYVFRSEAGARRAFARLGGLGVPRCYAGALKRAIVASSAGYAVGSVKTRRLKLAPVGDATAAARVSLGISRSGATGTLYSDLVTIRSHRSVALAFFLNMDAPFDRALRDRLIVTQAGRLPR
jgi:hypothetical protein